MEEKRKVWDCQSAYLCTVVQKETLSLSFFFKLFQMQSSWLQIETRTSCSSEFLSKKHREN